MPTLQQRQDGGFFIRGCQRDTHHTWQCTGEGVRCLKRRGVSVGDSFGVALLMELYGRGLVFTERSGPVASPRGALPDELFGAVRALHCAVVQRDAALVERLVVRQSDSAQQLASRVCDGARLRRWKPRDAILVRQAGLVGALVTMSLTFDQPMECQQAWVCFPEWRLAWETFGAPPATTGR